MPIQNLARNLGSGGVYVERVIESPEWIPFPRVALPPGSEPVVIAVADYIKSNPADIANVAREGSANTAVFAITGTWAESNLTITATPRATVTENTNDSLVMRATAVSGALTATKDNTLILTTLKESVPRIFWTGTPGRSLNENDSVSIPLAPFIRGIPDDTFDSIQIRSKSPDVSWITLTNASAANAALRIQAPAVNTNTNVTVLLRVNKASASPAFDEITTVVTVLDIVDPEVEGVSIIGWDLPQGIQRGETFQVAILLDAPLADSDTLVTSDIVVDGLDGISITGVAKDISDDKRYIVTCAASQNIEGIVNFRYDRTRSTIPRIVANATPDDADSVTVSWSGFNLGAVDSWEIDYGTSSSSLDNTARVSGASATSYSVPSLDASTTYYFQVKAIASGGATIATSNIVSATTTN